MTDKEIEKQAEEYIDKIKSKYLLSEEGLGCAEQGFQDGAKWGMEYAIEWHDLRKAPNDLPPRSKDDDLQSVIVSNEVGEPIYYDYYWEEWCDMEGDVVSEGCKYWCELPTYKEEENE